jgi:hypothetical protein
VGVSTDCSWYILAFLKYSHFVSYGTASQLIDPQTKLENLWKGEWRKELQDVVREGEN